MARKIVYFILPCLMVMMTGCSKPVKVVKAEFAEYIVYSGGVSVSYTDKQTISMTLDFNYKNLDTKEAVGSDAYKSEVFQILTKNASFYSGDSLIEYTYGYWPDKITKTSADNLILYYLIPLNADINKVRFEYNTSVLNGKPGSFVYNQFAKMKPLKPKESK
jgi:hypothetical protein